MLTVKFIPELSAENVKEANSILASLTQNSVNYNNWNEEYPYAPQVQFSIAHNQDNLFIRFEVKENYTMAKVASDNGEVWTDSCVEFFIKWDESGYYNFEFTCIGKALVGFRQNRDNAVHADAAIRQSIKRYASLGENCFDEKMGDNQWSLTVVIPKTAFFKHNLASLQNLKAKGNFYKCGDNLTKPHFLSWQPIDNPTPNFHLKEFFGDIKFE